MADYDWCAACGRMNWVDQQPDGSLACRGCGTAVPLRQPRRKKRPKVSRRGQVAGVSSGLIATYAGAVGVRSLVLQVLLAVWTAGCIGTAVLLTLPAMDVPQYSYVKPEEMAIALWMNIGYYWLWVALPLAIAAVVMLKTK